MTKSKGGLGRGLAALIPTGPTTNTVSSVFLEGPPARSTVEGGGGVALATAPTNGNGHGGPAAVDGATVRADAATVLVDGDGFGAPEGPRYAEVPLESIRPNPRNPRTVFDEEALAELEHSIREFGLLQPIVVRPVADGYELIVGERRWRAAQRAGVDRIPAIVRRTEDADLLRDALLENIHRANLNPLEEAAAYQQLLEEFEVTHEELAARIGRSRPVISNTIRLLKLPVPVQRRVAAGVLSAGHARALLALDDADAQEELAARIVAEGLSVRGAEEAVTLSKGARKAPRPPRKKIVMPGLDELATGLSDTFDTRVKVQLGRRKGQIVVEFATVDDLERIVAIMAPAVGRRGQGTGPAADGGRPE